MTFYRLFRIALSLLFIGSSTSHSCSIPVFRYALERWQPTSYDFLIYHRGPMTAEQRQEVKAVRALARDANVEVTEIDLDRSSDPEFKGVWEKYGGREQLPWVIVRFPDAEASALPLLTGPLNFERLKGLIDSPIRRKIIHSLFRGESAVFVMLQSGDDKADNAAAKLLEVELPKLRTRIELPAPTSDGPQIRSEMPLKISFHSLSLKRADPDERAFIDLLMRSEEGLDKVKGPIVFAIYGRGRVLSALHGKDLKASELESVCRFLCGACSCLVKELNPGVDLLIRAHWDAFLEIELSPRPRIRTPSLEKQ